MTNLIKLAEMLQDSEIIILKSLAKRELVDAHKDLTKSEFYRSAMYIENKRLADIIRAEKQVVVLEGNGKIALEVGLPELRLLEMLRKESLSLSEAEKRLGNDELRFSMGYCRKAGWITIDTSGLKITAEGRKIKTSEESKLLKKIGNGEIDLDNERYWEEFIDNYKSISSPEIKRTFLWDIESDIIIKHKSNKYEQEAYGFYKSQINRKIYMPIQPFK